MSGTKIVFSKEELRLLNDSELWIVKRSVTEKLYELLGIILTELKASYENKIIKVVGLKNINGKISRGENYEGNPYVLLDYPNVFSAENIFALRTMFWYGEHLSVSLLLSGLYCELFSNQVIQSLKSRNEIYFCINESPWHHHFKEDNMKPLSLLTDDEIKSHIEKNKFIKLSVKCSINEPEIWEKFIRENSGMFLNSF